MTNEDGQETTFLPMHTSPIGDPALKLAARQPTDDADWQKSCQEEMSATHAFFRGRALAGKMLQATLFGAIAEIGAATLAIYGPNKAPGAFSRLATALSIAMDLKTAPAEPADAQPHDADADADAEYWKGRHQAVVDASDLDGDAWDVAHKSFKDDWKAAFKRSLIAIAGNRYRGTKEELENSADKAAGHVFGDVGRNVTPWQAAKDEWQEWCNS